VHYVCGSQKGWEREVIDVLGGGRSARVSGFRRVELHGGGRGGSMWRLQPDLGQRAMLEAMLAQFSRRGPDLTESFVASAQALLAAHRSIRERRVVAMEARFPFSPR
jgi:hypothetical protein